MGYPIDLALRYLGSKKRAFISVGTAFAILGVALGVAALATVMSVTGGFQAQFREKVLGVNAHVLVLKYSTDFREYRTIMEQVEKVPGVIGVAPFSINPMMLTHGDATATGVLLKGVDPVASLGVDAPRASSRSSTCRSTSSAARASRAPQATACGQDKLTGLRLAAPGRRSVASDRRPPAPDDGRRRRRRRGRRARAGTKQPLIEAPRGGHPAPRWKRMRGSATSRPRRAPAPRDDEAAVDDAPRREGAAGRHRAGRRLRQRAARRRRPARRRRSRSLRRPDAGREACRASSSASRWRRRSISSVGECVTVTSPTIGFSFSGGSFKPPVAKRFRVIAVFEAGFDQYDSKLVYTDLYEAQAFYDQGDTVTGVEMKVADIDQAPADLQGHRPRCSRTASTTRWTGKSSTTASSPRSASSRSG